MNWADAGILVAIFFGGALAAGGGLGGGGLFVPLLVLVTNFPLKTAIPLSNTVIAGLSIVNLFTMSRRRHPVADRPLIDYRLAMVMQPLLSVGTMFGVLFNSMFPNWLILVLLILTLGYGALRTIKKGLKTYRKERDASMHNMVGDDVSDTEDANEAAEVGPVPVHHRKGSVGGTSPPVGRRRRSSRGGRVRRVSRSSSPSRSPSIVDGGEAASGEVSELQQILQDDVRTPWKVVGLMAIVMIVVAAVTFIKRDPDSIGIPTCSAGYWVLTFIAVPIVGGIGLAFSRSVVARDARKTALGYPFVEGDIVWTRQRIVNTNVVSLVAGCIASLLGIGGGMVLGPLMLQLNVLPEVTAATSSLIIFFSSWLSTIQYLAIGRIDPSYGAIFFVLGMIDSLVGVSVLTHIVHRYNKKSIVIFVIASILVLSLILLGYTGVLNTIADFERGDAASIGFTSPC
jgi:uncharacterized membrane protein YfcA